MRSALIGLVIRKSKLLIVAISTISLVIAFILTLQYYHTEIFNKTPNEKFNGSFFYNPYQYYSHHTLRANFHAHSIAWLSLTNGYQKPNEIYNHYKDKGYDIASLSNYQNITIDTSNSLYLPAYEHGYNLKKRHHIIIGAESVSFFDFAIFQTHHNKQQVIKKLQERNGLIAIAHPRFNNAYNKEDMKFLRGYDFIEVFTYYRSSPELWDAALSNGYPAWLMANDDCHDINKNRQCIVNWTRISPKAKSRKEVMEALKTGCFYGVRNEKHEEINSLDSCIVVGNQIIVYFKSNANRLSFVADNGEVKYEVLNQKMASYTIKNTDSYVRVEAQTGDELIYLNPIIKYDGISLPSKSEFPTVNIVLTVLFRLIVLLTNALIVVLILLINGRFNTSVHLIRSVVSRSKNSSPVK